MASNSDLDSIKTQIEFYFSPANLARDTYLISQMNSSKFVDVSVIANFPKVQSMSTDIEVIKQAIKTSKVLEFDSTGTKIRDKSFGRTSLILRDVDSDVTKEDIQEVISKVIDASLVTKIRADIASVWYVDFVDEASCLNAYNGLFSQTLKGKPVYCTIKTAPIVGGSINVYNNASGDDKSQKRSTRRNTSSTTLIKYTREQMAAIITNMSSYSFTAPDTYLAYVDDNTNSVPIIRTTPSTTTTLLEPIPVMYPASPSPEMAMNAPKSGNLPPFFDLSQPLNTTMPTLGGASTNTTTTTSTSITTDLSSLPTSFQGLNLTSSAFIPTLVNSANTTIPTNTNTNTANANNKRQNSGNMNKRQNNQYNNTNQRKSNTQRKSGSGNTTSNNNANFNRRKHAANSGLAIGVKSVTASTTASTMNFASIVAQQPTEETVARATETFQRNVASRQPVASKNTDDASPTANETGNTTTTTTTNTTEQSSKPKRNKKKNNAAKKEQQQQQGEKKETDQVVSNSNDSKRWSDLLKSDAN